MHTTVERRRGDREGYRVLRALARLLSFLGFVALALGAFVGAVLLVYGEQNFAVRFGFALSTVLAGGLCYILLRAAAQAGFILLDIARHARACREMLARIKNEKNPQS